jgi:hypothetical protein
MISRSGVSPRAGRASVVAIASALVLAATWLVFGTTIRR